MRVYSPSPVIRSLAGLMTSIDEPPLPCGARVASYSPPATMMGAHHSMQAEQSTLHLPSPGLQFIYSLAWLGRLWPRKAIPSRTGRVWPRETRPYLIEQVSK